MPTDLDACQSLIEQQARALDQLLAGSTDYESLRADVWKQSHPEAVRTYRSDERRDTADRNRLTRAQRRLANAKKLEAARLAAKTTEAEQQKSRFIDKLSARRKFLSGQGFTGIGHLRSGGRCTRQLTGGVEVVVIVERIQRIRCRASHGPPNCRRFSTRTPPASYQAFRLHRACRATPPRAASALWQSDEIPRAPNTLCVVHFPA